MDSTDDTADRSMRIWLARTRQLLNNQLARRPATGAGGRGHQMDLATADPTAVQRVRKAGAVLLRTDDVLSPDEDRATERQPVDRTLQMDLAEADPAVVQRVRKAAALRLRINGVPSPDEATATDLVPFDQARQTALNALDAAPLTEAVLTAAAQEFLHLQSAANSVATAVRERLQALVNSTATPLLHPSLQAPPDAEGAEWDAVKQAVGLASAIQGQLLTSVALRSAHLQPLQAQVDAVLQARDSALQAIQKRLQDAAAVLLARVEPAALGRDADARDGEWQPVATLVSDVQAVLNKPTLGAKDIATAAQRLQQLSATKRDVMVLVRERLSVEEGEVRTLANQARRDFEKQCKGKLSLADTGEKSVLEEYRRQLDQLTKPAKLNGGQIAQVRKAAGEGPAIVETVHALIEARDALKFARDGLHGDVRREAERSLGADPAQQAFDKARVDAANAPAADHRAALEAGAQDVIKALRVIEVNLLKAEVTKLSTSASASINEAVRDCASEISPSGKDPTRVAFGVTARADPELLALSGQIKNVPATLVAATDYIAVVKSLPPLEDRFKRRAKILAAEQGLKTALEGTPSASGKSADERMTLLHGIRSDLDQLRAEIDSVQVSACKLPAGERLIKELVTVEGAVDKAQANTLEDDCKAWRKKLDSLRSSFDSDITSLRVARTIVADGAAYLRDKSKLYRSGGTPPTRGAVETAIGAPGNPGHGLMAWSYTWDTLLAEIRNDLTDGYLTQVALENLTGGTAGQRYVQAGKHHVSISFVKENDLYRVTQIHVTREKSTYKYFFNVNKGVITPQVGTALLPNPTAGTPASYVVTATNLVATYKSKFNCK